MTYNFVTKETTMIVIISGEFVAEWLSFVSSTEWKMSAATNLKISWGGKSCDTMADTTGHRLHGAERFGALYDEWLTCGGDYVENSVMVQLNANCLPSWKEPEINETYTYFMPGCRTLFSHFNVENTHKLVLPMMLQYRINIDLTCSA